MSYLIQLLLSLLSLSVIQGSSKQLNNFVGIHDHY